MRTAGGLERLLRAVRCGRGLFAYKSTQLEGRGVYQMSEAESTTCVVSLNAPLIFVFYLFILFGTRAFGFTAIAEDENKPEAEIS